MFGQTEQCFRARFLNSALIEKCLRARKPSSWGTGDSIKRCNVHREKKFVLAKEIKVAKNFNLADFNV